MKEQIPVIDLFAGPGGLGEGFSSLESEGRRSFRVALSIEKDEDAHRTLRLRSFWRQFDSGEIPDDYAAFARQELSEKELFNAWPDQAEAADREAWCAELGGVTCPPDRLKKRIKDAIGASSNWVLIGGPPCQAYSLVGRARQSRIDRKVFEKDERHTLYRRYLEIIASHEPPVFVMENVKGMLSSTHGGKRIVEKILDDLRSPRKGGAQYKLYSFVRKPRGETLSGTPDFEASDFVIRSEDYGIPQRRHRVIILGIRDDLKGIPDLLKQESSVPLESALSGLPKLRSSISSRGGHGLDWRNAIRHTLRTLTRDSIDAKVLREMKKSFRQLDDSISTGELWMPYRPGRTSAIVMEWYRNHLQQGICNHEARSHMPSDLGRYFFAACFARVHERSPVLADFPALLLPEHANVDDGVAGTVFADRFRVQLWDQPATTVTSHIAKDGHYFIHPDPLQCRSLTVREAARIQTFPDSYIFLGTRTAQYHQVGNAVPPLLAKKLAEIVYNLIR